MRSEGGVSGPLVSITRPSRSDTVMITHSRLLALKTNIQFLCDSAQMVLRRRRRRKFQRSQVSRIDLIIDRAALP